MRTILVAAIALIAGCQTDSPPSYDPHPLTSIARTQQEELILLREQNQKLSLILAQMQLVASKVHAPKDPPAPSATPPAAPIPVPTAKPSAKYTMTSGFVGVPNSEMCYLLHVESGKIVMLTLSATTGKFEVQAGRDIAADLVWQSSVTPKLGDGAGFLTLRFRENEDMVLILDHANERLQAYRADMGKRRIEQVESLDLKKLFNIK